MTISKETERILLRECQTSLLNDFDWKATVLKLLQNLCMLVNLAVVVVIIQLEGITSRNIYLILQRLCHRV